MKGVLPIFLFLTLATVRGPLLAADYPTLGAIERVDPALDKLIAPDAKIEKLCEGFTWSEGPVWKDGALLFSDVPENIIYRWKPGTNQAEIFLKPSGMLTPREGFREQGSNGLTVDAANRLVICEHGERRVARLGPGQEQTAIVDHFEGKHFNSPNDLVFRSNGDLYFTDPPYGLDGLNKSPLKELSVNGVYRVTPEGEVSLVIKDLAFPNGIAFSPDERILYVGVTEPGAPRIMAYAVQADGSLDAGRLFFDARPLDGKGRGGSCDGMKVDVAGNIFSSGPGGVVIISPEGKHLGTISTGTLIANCAWGDDGSTLYLTCHHMLCRVRTSTKGARPTDSAR